MGCEEGLVVQGVTGGGLATRQSRGAMGGGGICMVYQKGAYELMS